MGVIRKILKLFLFFSFMGFQKDSGEGSYAGFLASTIGGFMWGGFGLVFFGFIVFNLYGMGWTGGDPSERIWFLARIISALYISVLSIWIISAGYWMRKRKGLKKGALTALTLGILSLNILSVIGGILGLVDFNKDKEEVLEKIGEIRKVEDKSEITQEGEQVKILGS